MRCPQCDCDMVLSRPRALERVIMRLARSRRPFRCFGCGCRRLLRLTLCLLVLLGSARIASASSIALRITDGTTTVTVFDNGVGDGNTVSPGTIVWSGVVGDWFIDVVAGKGEDAIGVPPGGMDLHYDVSSLGTGTTLSLMLTQYDMTPAYPGWSLEIGGTNIGTGVTYDAFADDGNTQFGMVSPISLALGPFTSSPFAAVGGSSMVVSPLYSLTQRLRFTSPGEGLATGDAALLALPEPASMFFVGSGLLALAQATRRARKRT